MYKQNVIMAKYLVITLSIIFMIVMYSSTYSTITITRNGDTISENNIGITKISTQTNNEQEQFLSLKQALCSNPSSDDNFNKCEFLGRVSITYTIALGLLILSFTPGMCHVMITASITMIILTVDTMISMKKIVDDTFEATKTGFGITSGDSIQVGGDTIKVSKSNSTGFTFTILTIVLAIITLIMGFKDEIMMVKDRFY